MSDVSFIFTASPRNIFVPVMNAYEEMDVQLHALLALALDTGEW